MTQTSEKLSLSKEHTQPYITPHSAKLSSDFRIHILAQRKQNKKASAHAPKLLYVTHTLRFKVHRLIYVQNEIGMKLFSSQNYCLTLESTQLNAKNLFDNTSTEYFFKYMDCKDEQ